MTWLLILTVITTSKLGVETIGTSSVTQLSQTQEICESIGQKHKAVVESGTRGAAYRSTVLYTCSKVTIGS